MKKVLVTGGCGYIGSHTMVDLIEAGIAVVSVDNLVNSSEDVLQAIYEITGQRVTNYRIDLTDRKELESLFAEHQFDGIIHFAALKSVGESTEKPLLYHRNNLLGLINLLEAQERHQVKNFIFSSSCTVYGNPDTLPVTEDAPFKTAESPYGRTKQYCEGIITDFARRNPQFNFVNLRYFNPGGAHASGLMGESPEGQALNLIPIITETAIGKRKEVVVFGDDYPTRDGSCIRDYIYIMDLARAHTLSYQFAAQQELSGVETFNLGSGTGITVLEAIAAFEEVSGLPLNVHLGPRRPGDVVAIYADYEKAAAQLGWKPEAGIKMIMRTAWQWETKRSSGT